MVAYAINRELKTKESFFPAATPPQVSDRVERGRLDVANLRHPGGAPPRRRALPNLMDSADHQLKIRTHVRPEPLDITDPALFDYHLVFMHGRIAFRLTDSERRQLKQYLDRGGMLLADSICASRAFSELFRAGDGRDLARPQAGADSRRRSALEHGLWRVRPAKSLAARPGSGRYRQTAFGRDPQSPVRPGGDQVWRPMGRGLFAKRFELRLGEAELVGVSRLHAGRRARVGLNVVLYSLQQ